MNDTAVGCEWTLTTPPVLWPITLDEAKQQTRITQTAQDALLTSYLKAATQEAEDYMARGLMTQTWTLMLQNWADIIWLPMAAPLQSITSVKYYDTAGAFQTLVSTVYTVDTVSRPGKIARAPSQVWLPLQADRKTGRIEITYVVGYTAVGLVPERIKQGIRLYVGALEMNREGIDEATRKACESCWSDRVFWKPPQCAPWPY